MNASAASDLPSPKSGAVSAHASSNASMSKPACKYVAKVADLGLSVMMEQAQSHVSNMRVGTPM
jgi:hypothetical protein